MRYTTKQLYKIDPKTFIGRPYEEVLVEKLNALIRRRKELALALKQSILNPKYGYEVISLLMDEFKYAEGAEKDHRFLLDEMGINHVR